MIAASASNRDSHRRMRAVKTCNCVSTLMNDSDEEKARVPSINWFLVDQEIPVREMFQLALANWIAAKSRSEKFGFMTSGLRQAA